jgi:hypothetical protein
MLAIQSIRVLAVACRYSTTPTTHWHRQPLLLCNPLLTDPMENGRRAFAVWAYELAVRRDEHLLSIRFNVVRRCELHRRQQSAHLLLFHLVPAVFFCQYIHSASAQAAVDSGKQMPNCALPPNTPLLANLRPNKKYFSSLPLVAYMS